MMTATGIQIVHPQGLLGVSIGPLPHAEWGMPTGWLTIAAFNAPPFTRSATLTLLGSTQRQTTSLDDRAHTELHRLTHFRYLFS